MISEETDVVDSNYQLPESSEVLPLSPTYGKSYRSMLALPVAAGVAGIVVLAGLYIAIVSLAQGFDHAWQLMVGDWYFVIPILIGFGVQVGLFVYVRKGIHLRQGTGSTTALAGAGTGTSTISMVACCAHHVADMLPKLGLSGAALFLNEYRNPLMAIGIFINLIGIVAIVCLIRKTRQPKA